MAPVRITLTRNNRLLERFNEWKMNRPDIPGTLEDLIKLNNGDLKNNKEIISKGYVKRGDKPVHWCVDCGSSLAEAEVEYKDKTSHAIDVWFPVVDSQALAKALSIEDTQVPTMAIIWTTTPWTLPANMAVCVSEQVSE